MIRKWCGYATNAPTLILKFGNKTQILRGDSMRKVELLVDFLVILLCLVCIGAAWNIKFNNPGMTETELFIEFFGQWVLLIIILILGLAAHKTWGIK